MKNSLSQKVLKSVFAQSIVQAGYEGILSRAPDAAGRDTYVRHLRGTGTLDTFLRDLSRSEEGARATIRECADTLVASVRKAIPANTLTDAEWGTLSAGLRDDGDVREFVDAMLRNANLRLAYDDASEAMHPIVAERWIESAYLGILGREADGNGLRDYGRLLTAPSKLSALLDELAGSDEAWRRSLVKRAPEITAGIAAAMHTAPIDDNTLADLQTRLVETQDINQVIAACREIGTSREVSASANTFLTPIEGVHELERDSFMWSRAESSFFVCGVHTIYLCAGLIPPGQTREIVATMGKHRKRFVLTSNTIAHELTLFAPAKGALLRFSANGEVRPRDIGSSRDMRALSFQVFLEQPKSTRVAEVASLPAIDPSVIHAVFFDRKEHDSLAPICDALEQTGYRVLRMTVDEARQYFLGATVTDATFLIAIAGVQSTLRSWGLDGTFIYAEHGVSPLKQYTYMDHYQEYDLALLPGSVWVDRVNALYPSTRGRAKVVGYPKLRVTTSDVSARREALCKRLDLDPSRPLILFAPTWSGGDQNAGVFNLRHFRPDDNVFAIPHDGDVSFLEPLKKAGYRVLLPEAGESITDFYALADLLVSDVSSTAIEFAALGKPVVSIALETIPDFDHTYQESRLRVRIPHTDSYWDFCRFVLPEDVREAVATELAEVAATGKVSKTGTHIESMIACHGEASVALCVDEIDRFMKARLSSRMGEVA